MQFEYSPAMDQVGDLGLESGPSIDAALVTAAREGDRTAFGRLYDRFAPMVHGLLLARVPRADVDDLVHDVFLQAMRRLGSLRDLDAFGAWLAAIARNRARDHHRSLRKERDELSGRIESSQGDNLSRQQKLEIMDLNVKVHGLDQRVHKAEAEITEHERLVKLSQQKIEEIKAKPVLQRYLRQ